MLQPIAEKTYLVELNLGGVVGAQRQVNFQFIPQLKDAIIDTSNGVQMLQLQLQRRVLLLNFSTKITISGPIRNCLKQC
jgi:hypothetical protein